MVAAVIEDPAVNEPAQVFARAGVYGIAVEIGDEIATVEIDVGVVLSIGNGPARSIVEYDLHPYSLWLVPASPCRMAQRAVRGCLVRKSLISGPYHLMIGG
jgi:hypothetical protein